MAGGETNLAAFVGATILAVWPSSPQVAPLAEPPVLVVYLKYKFKLKKSMTIRENNKKLMKNEYFIKMYYKIDKLM